MSEEIYIGFFKEILAELAHEDPRNITPTFYLLKDSGHVEMSCYSSAGDEFAALHKEVRADCEKDPEIEAIILVSATEDTLTANLELSGYVMKATAKIVGPFFSPFEMGVIKIEDTNRAELCLLENRFPSSGNN